ncbi:hypothetical protein ACRALDRAFT_1062023 [Sodiomyces alcalophilus JCM 7366]|uniref:uncharacterized protein n=1 Tax=Sodiomyces alcalophilus JCM 7366 TaxID=591952 RepID=UPI0039B41888
MLRPFRTEETGYWAGPPWYFKRASDSLSLFICHPACLDFVAGVWNLDYGRQDSVKSKQSLSDTVVWAKPGG